MQCARQAAGSPWLYVYLSRHYFSITYGFMAVDARNQTLTHELFLHLGHGKTGTTYLQNILALNVDRLEREGILYPVVPADLEKIKQKHAHINSGNGMLFWNSKELDASDRNYPKTLFSSEYLFHCIATQPDSSLRLQEASQHFSKVNALLFVRDPIEFELSRFQQAVKREGYFGSIESHILESDYTRTVLAGLTALRQNPQIRLTVFNYSRERNSLVDKFEAWLGLSRSVLEKPKPKRINRSLTFLELKAQRRLNQIFGQKAYRFSDFMCETFPNLKEVKLNISQRTRDQFTRLHGPTVDQINDFLPDHASLKII